MGVRLATVSACVPQSQQLLSRQQLSHTLLRPTSTYSVPVPDVGTMAEEWYKSPIWGGLHPVREAREEMKAARASGQSSLGITIEYAQCHICTCMIGPDFYEKALHLWPIFSAHIYRDDYGYWKQWTYRDEETGELWHDPDGNEMGDYYWEPDSVHIVFDVLNVCGTCASCRGLPLEETQVIATQDWQTLLNLPCTAQEQQYPFHVREIRRLARIRGRVQQHIQVSRDRCYQLLYAYYLNTIGWPVTIEVQRPTFLPVAVRSSAAVPASAPASAPTPAPAPAPTPTPTPTQIRIAPTRHPLPQPQQQQQQQPTSIAISAQPHLLAQNQQQTEPTAVFPLPIDPLAVDGQQKYDHTFYYIHK